MKTLYQFLASLCWAGGLAFLLEGLYGEPIFTVMVRCIILIHAGAGVFFFWDKAGKAEAEENRRKWLEINDEPEDRFKC